MMTQPRSILELMKALAGPIIWAAHFFLLYLVEAFACTSQGATGVVRWTGLAATAAALGVLALLYLRSTRVLYAPGEGVAQNQALTAFARPLILLSMVAILWTSAVLLLLPACAPAHA